MTTEPLDLDAIKARADAATPGPWWSDESDMCWRLHGVAGRIPAQMDGFIPEQIVNHQILKAPKKGTTQAEYWPNAADAEFITHAREDVPALIAELEQARRGGKELGKNVVFLMELIKDAFVRGADDPIGALNMLGNVVAEVFEDEGGLSPAEFSRVQQALDARETEQATREYEEAERRRAEVSRSLADIAHAQRPLTEHERAFQDGV